MLSTWIADSRLPSFNRLDRNINTDVLIIGGGMAGLLCAYMLQHSGVDCVLVEAQRIGSGITGNTTAKITAQHGLIYDKLLRRFGAERAAMYLAANEAALEQYRHLSQSIDCGFEVKDSFVYALSERRQLAKELEALDKLGVSAQWAEQLQLPLPLAGAVGIKNQAQFNPLQFAAAIADGLCIYENTSVRELAGHTAVTDNGIIKAENIIVATHFPFINKHGAYFLKMFQHRSYVIALADTSNNLDVQGMYVDEAETGLSFRNYGDLLLLGGGSHRTGKQGGGWRELETFAARHYPQAKIKFRWAAQDCMTLDGMPYIGRYAPGTPNLYVATGFNKWGMTSSMAAAIILTDLLTGRDNPYAACFEPSRSIWRPQLAVNVWEAAANLLTAAEKRCPHLGCALKWNSQEHSWDCPCHGSRFADDGRLLDNPATGDLRSVNKKEQK